MKPVGGFFELELAQGDKVYHHDAFAFSTGRTCLTIILEHVLPSKVYIPYYTCNALFQPMVTLKIPYEFYPIDEQLLPLIQPIGKDNELFLYTNYFGLCSTNVKAWLRSKTPDIIVDNTQAFFEKAYDNGWSFNSARKFFGVPDGAYLYAPYPIDRQVAKNTEFHFAHLVNRLSGKQQQAFEEFTTYERSLEPTVTGISLLSERLLSHVDYSAVGKKRRDNFLRYELIFKTINRLKLPLEDNVVPFAYPLLLDYPIDKRHLFEAGIFVPTLWQDTLTRNINGFEFEKMLSRCLLPLPVDHRYDLNDCDRVGEAVLRLVKS